MKIEFVYDAYGVIRPYRDHMRGLLQGCALNRPIDELIDDFLDIILIHLGQTVHELPAFMLNNHIVFNLPVSVKLDLQAQLTDLYHDNFYEYVFESDYFVAERIYGTNLPALITTACIGTMEALLRDAYAMFIAHLKDRQLSRRQGGEFDVFRLRGLQMYRLHGRTDIYVNAEVECQ